LTFFYTQSRVFDDEQSRMGSATTFNPLKMLILSLWQSILLCRNWSAVPIQQSSAKKL